MYKVIGGDLKQYGPISADDLRKWITEGRLNAQSLAQSLGDIEWRALSTFPEFADVLEVKAPAAAAVPSPTPAVPVDWEERDYELDLGGCIGRGWELVKNNFGPVVGITALVMIIILVINQILGLFFTRSAVHSILVQHRITPESIFVILVVTIVSGPIYTIFMAGLLKYYLKLIRGEGAGIGAAFSGFGPSIGQLILLNLVVTILTLIGYLLCLIPGIYLAVAWFFAVPLVIDRRMSFGEAMELSRKMVNKHWFLVFAFLLVYGLLSMAGLVACCIGVFVTMPIGLGALMYAYETIFSSAGPKAG